MTMADDSFFCLGHFVLSELNRIKYRRNIFYNKLNNFATLSTRRVTLECDWIFHLDQRLLLYIKRQSLSFSPLQWIALLCVVMNWCFARLFTCYLSGHFEVFVFCVVRQLPTECTAAYQGLLYNPALVPPSSPEALHIRRRERPLLARGGTMGEKCPIKFSLQLRLIR
jgi:hypothetical protein